MFIGAIFLGNLSDQIGRQPVFIWTLFVAALFGIASALAPNMTWFVIFRGLLGVGYGGNIVTDVTYMCEFLPPVERGRYLLYVEIFFGAGAMTIVVVGWLLIPIIGWRYLILMSTAPLFLVLFFRRNMPESPRYLKTVGTTASITEAVRILVEEVARTNRPGEESLEQEIRDKTSHWFDQATDLQRKTSLNVVSPFFSIRSSAALKEGEVFADDIINDDDNDDAAGEVSNNKSVRAEPSTPPPSLRYRLSPPPSSSSSYSSSSLPSNRQEASITVAASPVKPDDDDDVVVSPPPSSSVLTKSGRATQMQSPRKTCGCGAGLSKFKSLFVNHTSRDGRRTVGWYLSCTLLCIWTLNSFASSILTWIPLQLANKGRNTSSHGVHHGGLPLQEDLQGEGVAVTAHSVMRTEQQEQEFADRMQLAYLASLLMHAGDLVGIALLTLFVHRLDRRMILRAALFIVAFLCGLVGFALDAYHFGEHGEGLHWTGCVWFVLPVLASLRCIILSMLYVYTAEVYPTNRRATALGFMSSFHRIAPIISNFVVAILLTAHNSFAIATSCYAAFYGLGGLVACLLQYDTRFALVEDEDEDDMTTRNPE